MPSTIKTEEKIPKGTSDEALDRDIALRIKAGAIRCEIKGEGDERVLVTEWNVIGE